MGTHHGSSSRKMDKSRVIHDNWASNTIIKWSWCYSVSQLWKKWPNIIWCTDVETYCSVAAYIHLLYGVTLTDCITVACRLCVCRQSSEPASRSFTVWCHNARSSAGWCWGSNAWLSRGSAPSARWLASRTWPGVGGRRWGPVNTIHRSALKRATK